MSQNSGQEDLKNTDGDYTNDKGSSDVKQHDPMEGNADISEDKRAAPEVGEELSKVASSPQRNVFVFGAMAIGFLFMAWNLIGPQLFGDNEPKPITDMAPLPTGETVETPSEIEDLTPPIPQLPEPPKLVAPTPPPPPVDPAPPPPLPTATTSAPPPVEAPSDNSAPPPSVALGFEDEEAEARLQAKRKSPIQLFGGGAASGDAEKAAIDAAKPEAELRQSAEFKKRGNLNYVLGKGKVINAITETAINSDHPSEVRAVVTRDVYAESGKHILIPKGTRVFGQFEVTIEAGYGRVNIKWNRIDLATGYSIQIGADAVDNLGRFGTPANVDHKYKEQMANAILSSAFSIGIAASVDKLIPPVTTTQNAANTQQATNLQNLALSIFNDTSKTSSVRFEEIINTIIAQFPDKTSTAYTSFVQESTKLRGDASADFDSKLTSIMASVTSAATSLISNTTAASTPTSKQKAAESAIKDLTDKFKDIVKQQPLQPTTTVDQGTPIKIYINKDYLFPKDAISTMRVIK